MPKKLAEGGAEAPRASGPVWNISVTLAEAIICGQSQEHDMHDDAMVETRHMLACIGDHSRYLVIMTLAGGGQCVTEVAKRIGRSQSCTTRHLQALARGGIVERQRQGKRVVFTLRLDDPRVRGLVEWAIEHDMQLVSRPYLTAPNAIRKRSGATPPEATRSPGSADPADPEATSLRVGRSPLRGESQSIQTGEPSTAEEGTYDATDDVRPYEDLEDFLL